MSATRDARTRRLVEVRAKDTQIKTDRALQAVRRLHASGQPVTFARVAHDAAVSTWFTYNRPPVADAIRTAQLDQAEHGLHTTPSTSERVSAASLRADLEHSRAEVRSLRAENQQLRQAMAARLGTELTHPDPVELAQRLRQVDQRNRELADDLTASGRHASQLQDQLHTAQDELTAARESLRRMIRQGHPSP